MTTIDLNCPCCKKESMSLVKFHKTVLSSILDGSEVPYLQFSLKCSECGAMLHSDYMGESVALALPWIKDICVNNIKKVCHKAVEKPTNSFTFIPNILTCTLAEYSTVRLLNRLKILTGAKWVIWHDKGHNKNKDFIDTFNITIIGAKYGINAVIDEFAHKEEV